MRPSRRRMQQWTKMPRQLRPTKAGWIFLLLIMGIGFAALNTGNNLLYLVLSLMLAFLTLSGLLSESALRGIEIRRTLPREIFAESENPLLLEIRNNQKHVPAFALVVEDFGEAPVGPSENAPDEGGRPWWRRKRAKPEDRPALGRVFALRVGPESVEARAYPLRPERRGPIEFKSVRVATRFPFGLFMKSRTIAMRESGIVYPPVDRIEVETPGGGRRTHAGAFAMRTGQGDDVSGLREYGQGDSMRRVHWPSSLRRDGLLVRELDDDQSDEVEVRLRSSHEPTASDFESRVRRAASEIVAHLENGLRVGLVTDRERLTCEAGTRQRTRLLSHLALIDESPREAGSAGAS